MEPSSAEHSRERPNIARSLNSWIDAYLAAGLDPADAAIRAMEKTCELALQERKVARRDVEERERKWEEFRTAHAEADED